MEEDNILFRPQAGPQEKFVNLMAGIAGEEEKDEDFKLVFYGGAK
jgi:hypothetical protein